MTDNAIDTTQDKIVIPSDPRLHKELECDLLGSKKPESIEINSASIDVFIKDEQITLYKVPLYNVHHITSISCIEDLKSKKHALQVEVDSPIWNIDPKTGEKQIKEDIELVQSPFDITADDTKAQIASHKVEEKQFKKSQKLNDVQKALKALKKGKGDIIDVVNAIRTKQGDQRLEALNLVKDSVLSALQNETAFVQDYIIKSLFADAPKDLGPLPKWSFDPIYEIYTDSELQQKRKENKDIDLLLTNCAESLGGAHSSEQMEKLEALLLSDDVPPTEKAGLAISLGMTGQSRAAEVIVKFAKEKTMLDPAMKIIPMVLLELLNAREQYWNLQLYYAEKLANELYPPETFLGSYFYNKDWQDLDSFSQTDLEAINRILELLAERKSKFYSQFQEWEIDSFNELVQRWQNLKALVTNRIK